MSEVENDVVDAVIGLLEAMSDREKVRFIAAISEKMDLKIVTVRAWNDLVRKSLQQTPPAPALYIPPRPPHEHVLTDSTDAWGGVSEVHEAERRRQEAEQRKYEAMMRYFDKIKPRIGDVVKSGVVGSAEVPNIYDALAKAAAEGARRNDKH